jgi:hypothetical protein
MIINLLDNPSFELGWWHPTGSTVTNGWHKMHTPSPDGIPELQLPNYWGFIYADQTVQNPLDGAAHSVFRRPEVNHKHRNQLPPHEADAFIKHGDYCLKIFKGYGSFWCVLYTEVTAEPGSAKMVVDLFSDLVIGYVNGDKIPAPDPTSGQVRITIDETPGEWVNLPSLQNHIVEHAFEHPGGKIRAAVELRCPYPINNNGFFLDAWRLELDTEVVPDPECENKARVKYDRTAVLLPQYVDSTQAAEAMRYAWAAARWTVLGSADDAGIGCGLGLRRVIAIDPKGWPGSLEEFLDTYYEGAELWEASFDIPDINLINPSPYTLDQIKGRVLAADLLSKGVKLQYPTTHDDPHITNTFGMPGPNYESHNGLDFRSSYRVWGDEVLASIGGKVVRAGYYSAENWYGWQVRVETTLRDGRIMLTRYAHFEENGVYVSVGDVVQPGDKLGKPDNSGNSTGDHLHLDVKVEGGEAPAFYADPGMLIDWSFLDDQDDDSGGENIYPEGCVGYLGTQMLGGTAGIEQYWDTKPAVFKTVLMKSELGLFKQRSPGHPVYRHWTSDEGEIPKRPNKMEEAIKWVNLFIDDLAFEMRRYGFTECWVESVNEVYSNDTAHNINSINFDMAFIHALANINTERFPDLRFRPVVFTAAVGNPKLPYEPGGEEQWQMLLSLARLCTQHGGAFGYHAYWMANKDHPEWIDLLAPYLQHRWQEYDKWLRSHDVYVNWMLGESGPVGGELHPDGGITLLATKGWKGVYHGDWQRAENEFVKFDGEIEAFCAQYGQRAFSELFQSGSYDETWEEFEVEGMNLINLGRRL